MPILKPENMDFSDKKFYLVLAGSPGVGKTTLAMSAPNPILFDFDKGVCRLKAEHRGMTAMDDTYEDFLADLNSAEYKAAETIVIDTVGSLIDLMKPWAMKQDSKAAKDGRAMFGVIKQEFSRLMAQIRNVDKKNIVCIFHTTEQQSGDTVKTRLSCEGSVKDIVWTPADLGCYMRPVGGRRKLGFTPCDEYFAKSCYGIFGNMDVPELKDGVKNTFLTDLFNTARDNIKAEMQVYNGASTAYENAMKIGKKMIDDAKDAETLSIAASTISGLDHALTSKAELGKLIGTKAKALGLTYSKEANGYVPVSANGKSA